MSAQSGAAGAPPANPDRRLRQLLLPVYLPHLLISTAIATSFATLPSWSNQLVDSDFLAGIAIGMLYMASVIMNVVGGLVSGRIGINNTGGLGIVLFAAGAALEAFTANYGLLLAGRFVEGTGMAFWLVSRNSYMAAFTPNQLHGRAGGLFGSTFRSGYTLGPLIASLLIAAGSPALAWIGDPLQIPFYAKLVIAALAFAIYVPAAWRRDANVPRIYFKDMPRALKETVVQNRRNFFLVGLLMLIIQSLRTVREFMVPTIGVAIGADVTLVGYLVSASFALDATLALSAGVVMDRYGRKAAAIPYMLITAAAFVLLGLAAAFSLLALLVIAALMMGVGNGLSGGIIVTIGTDLAPRNHPEEFIGVWRSVNDVGGAVGPFLSGLISSFGALWISGAIFGGVALGGALLVWRYIPETLKRKQRHA